METYMIRSLGFLWVIVLKGALFSCSLMSVSELMLFWALLKSNFFGHFLVFFLFFFNKGCPSPLKRFPFCDSDVGIEQDSRQSTLCRFIPGFLFGSTPSEQCVCLRLSLSEFVCVQSSWVSLGNANIKWGYI